MLAPTSTTAYDIQSFWDAAIARGLFPLAIARNSKAPIGAGWDLWTHPIAHPGAGSVGLRCGDNGLTAFDVDVSDPNLSPRLLNAFRSVLGPNIPVRRGRPNRFLIPFYLVDAPVRGRTFTFANGEHLQLMGGQFIAFGPHKDTGQDYQWENWATDWPRLTTEQLQTVLSEVPLRAGTSLRFAAEHETASADELKYAKPQTHDEWQAGRDAADRYLGTLTHELRGKTEGRGSTIFALVGVLKFAEQNGIIARHEIEDAITNAGHSLDEGIGGRTLGEEITRQDQLPVLRGNLIMQAIMSRRTMLQGLFDAQTAPTLILRSGFEISLEDDSAELPWLFYQRILCGEVHFFTGHSGAGKSALVTDLSVQFLRGVSWLDADNERTNGHVLWIAAEDDYGTERRVRHLLRQEPNATELAARFHMIRGINEPMAFEQQCVAQFQAMTAMNKRIDIITLDTWGASGLCFADNDTEAVLKAMFILKSVARRTGAAVLVTDHLPLGNEDAWQKGNGAKTGNAGFVYRVTGGRNDFVSVDCGKARGAPKAKSYTGKIVSENYGKDTKGRTTTVNVFKRTSEVIKENKEQSAVLKLAAMLPGVTAAGMDALRAGSIVRFDSVAAEIGHAVKGEVPGYVVSKDAAKKMFEDGIKGLLESGHFRPLYGYPFLTIYPPSGSVRQELTIPFAIDIPKESFPWQ
jgi:AAA domain-containing protein/bifunctional DNA primase/polymerase-like protein